MLDSAVKVKERFLPEIQSPQIMSENIKGFESRNEAIQGRIRVSAALSGVHLEGLSQEESKAIRKIATIADKKGCTGMRKVRQVALLIKVVQNEANLPPDKLASALDSGARLFTKLGAFLKVSSLIISF